MTKQPYSHFDLPREFLSREGHYLPPKARDQAEIARRRSLPAGTLVHEQQAKGIEIASKIFASVETGEGMAFTTRLLGMTAINTSWYIFGQKAPDVMRRRLHLPKMANEETEERLSAAQLRLDTIQDFNVAHDLANGVAKAHLIDKLSVRRANGFGRHLGNLALNLAVLGDGQTTISGNAFEVQEEVRSKGLNLIDGSINFVLDHDSHPSFAQLADYDSPLGVHWRLEAPNAAFDAYNEAFNS